MLNSFRRESRGARRRGRGTRLAERLVPCGPVRAGYGQRPRRRHAAEDPDTWGICTQRAGKLYKARSRLARSRLYRSQILQVNTHVKALAEIYTIHSFAQVSWDPSG